MIAKSAIIHPTAILEGDVDVGAGTQIGPFCYLRGPVSIGSDNIFSSHIAVGQEAEHRKKGSCGAIYIGDNNRLREFVVIHKGTGERDTRVESNCYLMDHVHISHDCLVESDVTMSHNVVLGGHTIVQQGATLGILCAVHQRSTIGAYAMCGMGSVVTKDIPPFILVTGNPAKFKRLNTHQFESLGINENMFEIQKGRYTSSNELVREKISDFSRESKRVRLLEVD